MPIVLTKKSCRYFSKSRKARGMLNRKSDEGLTLIELLVVIAVVGLLASVIATFIGPARGKARDAIRETEMHQIFTAQEIVKGEDEQYALITTVGPTDPSDVTNTSIASAVGKAYLTPFPRDPASGSPAYKGFSNSLDRSKFCIYATLENTRTGCNPRYFIASHKGRGEVCNTAPVDLDCGL